MAKLRVGEGDVLYLLELPGGEFKLYGLDAEVAEQVRIGEEIMKRCDETFRFMAK